MRVLIIGSGGREHALQWKLAQSPLVEKIFVAPGNGGTRVHNVPLAVTDFSAIRDFCEKENIDLVVPGPELPLTAGLVDYLASAGISCFGPDKFCAQLEGSKEFAKRIMQNSGVPTATFRSFANADEALEYIREKGAPLVIKADGLAAGKGVIVADTLEEAENAVESMLLRKDFGEAGSSILVEEKLEGEEVSLLCFCDGENARPLASAQDHKAAFDGDTGPNTGGMGAYSPAPLLPMEELENMTDTVIRPVLKEMARLGHPFKGVLYAGLMLTEKGPKVLEYNVRFGDPECQPLMMRLKGDLANIMLACVNGQLANADFAFMDKSALGVVMVANGYPGSYEKDLPIKGLEDLPEDICVFHAGTYEKDGCLHSNGGRVLCVSALGDTLKEAQDNAYAAIAGIRMPGGRYRKDIGAKGLKYKRPV